MQSYYVQVIETMFIAFFLGMPMGLILKFVMSLIYDVLH
jgi:hypothetical protein